MKPKTTAMLAGLLALAGGDFADPQTRMRSRLGGGARHRRGTRRQKCHKYFKPYWSAQESFRSLLKKEPLESLNKRVWGKKRETTLPAFLSGNPGGDGSSSVEARSVDSLHANLP